MSSSIALTFGQKRCHPASIGEQVAELVVAFGGGVDGAEEFELHAPGQFASLARPADHLMCHLLRRRRHNIMMRESVLCEDILNRLRTEIVIYVFVHYLLSL